ncbi:MAG TPA: phospholipid carrier-dependent glycosyltransferase [Ignavibacteriaceae bacterium]|nr:phospholipid carrier-dependent glycosyltransferase [Ignavibacteriaceae bacterium]
MIYSEWKKYLFKTFNGSRVSKYLICILLLAAILRFSGIFWGIPVFDSLVQNYHPDEPKIIKGAFQFPQHILRNNDLRYPTFYSYFLGTLSIPAKIFFKLLEMPDEKSLIFVSVFARFVTVLLGLGAVFLTFKLGKKLYEEKAGLLSALFLSLSLYHIQSSGWAALDAVNSFFIVLTLLLAYQLYENSSAKLYLITGISLGILIGTKYNGVAVLPAILILHFYKYKQNNSASIFNAALSKKLWLLLITSVIVFIMTTPGVILKPEAFKESISGLINLGPGKKYRIISDPNFYFSIIRNYFTATDLFLTFTMFLGLIFPIRKLWDKEVPIIFAVILFFFAFGALASRQLIAVLPLTSILAAQAVLYLYKKMPTGMKAVLNIVLVLWLIFSIVFNSYAVFQRLNDTRTAAAHYIDKNIAAGSSIGAGSIGNYQRWSWMMPKIDPLKYKIADPLEKPEFIILTSYDYTKMEGALLSGKLHDYNWDKNYSTEWYMNIPPSHDVFLFYEDILNGKGNKFKYRLLKKFEKKIYIPIEFPPPQIRIYQRSDNI